MAIQSKYTVEERKIANKIHDLLSRKNNILYRIRKLKKLLKGKYGGWHNGDRSKHTKGKRTED